MKIESKVREILIYLAIFFVPIVFSVNYYEGSEFKSTLLLAIFAVFILFYRGAPRFPIPLKAFFILTTVSFLRKAVSFETQLFFVKFLALVVIALEVLNNKRITLKKVSYLLLFQLIIVVGFSVWKRSPGLFFGNPNFFAGYILLAVPIALFVIKNEYIYMVLTALVLISLEVFSGARAGIMSAGLWTFLALFFVLKKRVIVFLLSSIIVLFLFFYIAQHNSKTNNSFRIYTYMAGLQIIKEHPGLGIGVGQFRVRYPEYRLPQIINIEKVHSSETVHAHNEILELFIEQGVLGIAAFLILFFVPVLWIPRLSKIKDYRFSFLLVAMYAFMFDNLFSVNMRYTGQRLLFFLAIALIYQYEEVDEKNNN